VGLRVFFGGGGGGGTGDLQLVFTRPGNVAALGNVPYVKEA